MQALSQVSYTPTDLAVIADSFISIAAFSLFVKHFFEFFLLIPFLPSRGFQPILQNGPLCSCAALARQTCVFRYPAPPGHPKGDNKKSGSIQGSGFKYGGGWGTRTLDLCDVNAAL